MIARTTASTSADASRLGVRKARKLSVKAGARRSRRIGMALSYRPLGPDRRSMAWLGKAVNPARRWYRQHGWDARPRAKMAPDRPARLPGIRPRAATSPRP